MKRAMAVLLLVLLTDWHPAEAQTRYWISPASTRSDFWDMFSSEARWDTLLSKVSIFSLHVNALNRADSNKIKTAIARLKSGNLLVNFECGGLRPFSGCDSLAGERHAQLEWSNLSRWVRYGGRIDYITMDSPINTMIKGGDPSGTCDWTVGRTANEIVDYMKEMRKNLSGVIFALVEPVPWYRVGIYPSHPGNNYGDLIQTLDTVIAIVKARGEKIEIFHSDSPYGYSDNPQTQGWLKIKAVEEWLHSKELRHGRINNSEQGGLQSNQLFYEQTMDSYRRYKAVGGNPDEIEVWCWYEHPDVNAPESVPYTFTYTCKKLIELAQGGSAAILASLEPPNGKVYHGVGQSMTGVSEYVQAMGDSSLMPAAFNFYYEIPGTRGDKFVELRQTLESEKKLGRIPHLSIAMTDGPRWTDSIIANSNRYDYAIDSIGAALRDFGRRAFIRPGFEFNGSWFPYHPYEYPKAFQKIVSRIRAVANPDSLAFLWCYYSAAPADFDSTDAFGSRWYPGDTAVDWFSLDLFGSEDFHPDSASYKRNQITKKGKSEKFLAMARSKNKPVFLSEVSAAYTFLTPDPQDGQTDWNMWFAPFFRLLDIHPEIKAYNYTNWNWMLYGQWKEWGDARIEVNSYVLSHYKDELKKTKYIHLRSGPTTDVDEPYRSALPTSLALYQNYPNPFNPSTVIRYRLVNASSVSLKIFNTLGQCVATLVEENENPGIHQQQWNPNLPSGMYFYRLQVRSLAKGQDIDYYETKKMLLLK